MKEKEKKEKQKKAKTEWWVNNIVFTVQRDDKRRIIRISNSDMIAWFEKYYSVRKKAIRAASICTGSMMLLEANDILTLLKAEGQEKETKCFGKLFGIIMEYMQMWSSIYLSVMILFIQFQRRKAKKSVDKRFSDVGNEKRCGMAESASK